MSFEGVLQSTTITFSRCHTLEDRVLVSIILASVLITLAPGASNKILFSTHRCYLGTTYMGGKKLSIIIVYRIKGCFSFRLYIGVFCFMEHLVTCPSLALPMAYTLWLLSHPPRCCYAWGWFNHGSNCN